MTNVNITDSDYMSYTFSIGNLSSEETITRSYLLNFTRNLTTYYNTTSIAQAYGIDSYSFSQISANSSSMNLPIPSMETGEQLILIKNVIYNNQTSANVNYTVIVEVINSGGVDLTGIAVTDDDLDISEIISLSKTQSHNYSDSLIISKDQDNKEQTFSIARGTVNLVIYSSNQIKILIPGYGGGPNDVSINAPTSVSPNTNFNAVMTVKNKNKDIGQDFILNYWLLSNNESITYSTGAQTLYVGANDNTNSTTIVFLSPSSDGTYKIRANVTGTGVNVQATALSTIVVTSSANETPENHPKGGSNKNRDVTGEVTEEITCSAPYILYDEDCCLDLNNNLICDKDEIHVNIQEQENETKENETNITNGIPGENIHEKESLSFKNIKDVIGNLGSFFSSVEKKISQSKSRLFFGFGIFIFILLLMFIAVRVSKKRRANLIEQSLREGLELAGEGKIDEAREIYRNIKKIYKSNEDTNKEIYSHISRFYNIINKIK
ncbi:MAG: hypothetical protein NTZ83_01285 [Candidatus Pacearchaeota archaeon]|nr:hypothetical protein [Candidatus Pacearchaeota archaeon]